MLICLNQYCLGSFEREVLKHFDSIVERSLPIRKVISYYKQCPGAAKQVILDYVTFFEERKKVSHLKDPGISFNQFHPSNLLFIKVCCRHPKSWRGD